MASASAFSEPAARATIAPFAGEAGSLLPILHALQKRFGYIDKRAVPIIAEALNLSRAEVHGVVSFYHDFRVAPFEGRVLKLCRAESCQAAGADELVAHLAARHGLVVDREVGPIKVETVYCLGNCALSPAALIDGEPIGRLDAARLDDVIAAAKAGGR